MALSASVRIKNKISDIEKEIDTLKQEVRDEEKLLASISAKTYRIKTLKKVKDELDKIRQEAETDEKQ